MLLVPAPRAHSTNEFVPSAVNPMLLSASGAPGTPTTLTASGSTHTKGNWSEITAATTWDVFFIEVFLMGTATANTDTGMLVDIGIGANPNEVVIIPDLDASCGFASASTQNVKRYAFPLFVPSGTRLAGRCQATIASDTTSVWLRLWGRPRYPFWVGQHVTAYGPNGATSKGAAVTPGNGTEGGWTEITSSTSRAHRWLAMGVGMSTDTTFNVGYCSFDVGAGASTAEQEIAANIIEVITETGTEDVRYPRASGMPVDVPSGTRLCARGQHSSAAQVLGVSLYGVS